MLDDRSLGYALGATDYLTKPIDRERLVAALAPYRRELPVLIVDDDPDLRALLRRLLEREGYGVAEADNGRSRARPGARAHARRDPARPHDAGDGRLRVLGGAATRRGGSRDPCHRDHGPGPLGRGPPAPQRFGRAHPPEGRLSATTPCSPKCGAWWEHRWGSGEEPERRGREGRRARLPRRANRILGDERVGAEHHQSVDDGLAHEHPVEGIAMERRKPVEMQGRFLVQPQSVSMPWRRRCAGTNRAGASGSGSRPAACLRAISHAETALR